MFCVACAAHNPAGPLRCTTCGARLRADPPSASREFRGGKPRVHRTLTVVPLVVLLLAGGFSLDAYHAQHASLAAAYARADAAFRTGDYATAIADFTAAGTYRDAEARRAAAVAASAPYHSAYLTGVNAIQTGDYAAAIASLLPVVRALPGDEDARRALDQARQLQRQALLLQADAAEARRDWIDAERILRQILAAGPEEAAVRDRLADLERTHAPLLFARDGAISIVGPDGQDAQVVTDALPAIWPAWSPDYSRIAFLASDNGQVEHYGLYVVNLDGTGLTKLAPDVQLEGWPQWSPDGTKIAYDSHAPFELDNEEGISALHVVDVATGVDTDYTSAGFHETTTPTWAPDGQRIAFISKKVYQRGVAVGRRVEGAVHVVDLRTREITDVGGQDLPYADDVLWSPAGDRLLVHSSELGSAWYATMITTIQTVDLGTGLVEQVTGRSKTVGYPVWSPDGSRFAYVEGSSTVQIRTVDGVATTYNLPRNVIPFPTWSPDGSRLVLPAADDAVPSLIVDLADGGKEFELSLAYDFSDLLEGPPLWAPLSQPGPSGPPTIGGTALDP